jgi:hypothetical protein
MVESEQTSIAEQQIENHVPVTANTNGGIVAWYQVAKHQMLRGNK